MKWADQCISSLSRNHEKKDGVLQYGKAANAEIRKEKSGRSDDYVPTSAVNIFRDCEQL